MLVCGLLAGCDTLPASVPPGQNAGQSGNLRVFTDENLLLLYGIGSLECLDSKNLPATYAPKGGPEPCLPGDRLKVAQRSLKAAPNTARASVGVQPSLAGQSPGADASRGAAARSYIGSAFFVSASGHVLTNAHVVAHCTTARLMLPGEAVPARIVARDPGGDLALLQAERAAPAVGRLRPTIRKGEPVAAYGYPLAGLLASGGNFTTGSVTALAGLRDDASRVQISAPIQPGNSGGPLLDESGNVVGVVVGKLDAMRVAQVVADLPQNVNFAVKGSVVTAFLEVHAVPYSKAQRAVRLSPSDVAARAREFSVRVECDRSTS